MITSVQDCGRISRAGTPSAFGVTPHPRRTPGAVRFRHCGGRGRASAEGAGQARRFRARLPGRCSLRTWTAWAGTFALAIAMVVTRMPRTAMSGPRRSPRGGTVGSPRGSSTRGEAAVLGGGPGSRRSRGLCRATTFSRWFQPVPRSWRREAAHQPVVEAIELPDASTALVFFHHMSSLRFCRVPRRRNC